MENKEFNTVKKFAYGWFIFVALLIVATCGGAGFIVFSVLR